MRTTYELNDKGCVLLTVCDLAGAQFADQGLLRSLTGGTELTLVREAENQYDARAVRVDGPTKLGYIPGKSGRDENWLLSHLMDKGCALRCIIRNVIEDAEHIRNRVILGVYIQL